MFHGLRHHALQLDLAARLHVDLLVAKDPHLGDCERGCLESFFVNFQLADGLTHDGQVDVVHRLGHCRHLALVGARVPGLDVPGGGGGECFLWGLKWLRHEGRGGKYGLKCISNFSVRRETAEKLKLVFDKTN